MKLFFYYFMIFFTYSVIGWIVESLFVSLQSKPIHFINRGFLVGPYCPIYGYGSLGMILYLEQYKNNLVTVFLLSVIICTILEYVTSYIMEKLFKTRLWDYSKKKFNLNGRVCGENALLFGLGGVIIVYVVHPLLNGVLNQLDGTILLMIEIILFVIFLTDTIVSFNIMNRFKKTISNIDMRKDSTLEFKKMVSDKMNEGHKIFQERLLKAFPNIDLNPFNAISKELKGLLKK
mgnify:CR=1 FL=1